MSARIPVTVVIPAYKAAAYLPGAIATVRAQTVAVDEIVVVDDGSPGDDAAVARALGATVVSQANAGCGPARNAGIAAARSPWIALLDADDRWEPEKLERQWAARAAWPEARLISCDYREVRAGVARATAFHATCAAYAAVPKTLVGSEVALISGAALAAWLPMGQFLAPSTILVERELAASVPFARLVSTSLYHLSEDIEWYLRVARVADAVVVERALMRYAIAPGALSSDLGRMHYGMVRLGEAIAAAPGRYADGSLTAFARVRSRDVARAVQAYVRALDPERASAVLRETGTRPRTPRLMALTAIATLERSPFARRALGRLFARWQARRSRGDAAASS